ncbi:MAG: antitoxin family protein [Desulfurococcales archaeon]|nr:antitoxin family protein [Desulfurococcales archaeon]
MFKAIRVRYEKGVLKPLEPVELREGEEVLVWIEGLEKRREVVEEFYGKRGPAPKELLDEFMLEAEAQ